MEEIKLIKNEMPASDDSRLSLMSVDNVARAHAFHKIFPQYSRTPLAHLKGMAHYLGVKDFFVKDESYRFGLNSFKVVGGSFAMASYIAQKTGMDVAGLTYEMLTSGELKAKFPQATFITATDGNHGRAVAWSANKMGQKCVVLMPKGTTRSRFENIRKEGASVTIEEGNYDECVRMANTLAEKTPGSVIIQDTAWEGYEDIPTWIMQGYGTIAMEAAGQLDESGFGRPTHVFVQAGVGSFAGAVQGYLANLFPGCCPVTTVVEAQAADCHFASAAARDGEIHPIVGEMNTIMAGLACGEPNTISFDILRNHSSFFASCPDWVTMLGMRMLGAPVKGDPQVVSGESGAVAMGLVASIMKNPEYAPMKEALKLDESSKILMFSTEGDTEPENYRKIVWRV